MDTASSSPEGTSQDRSGTYERGHGVCDFVQRLFRMLDDPASAHTIEWSQRGDCFVVTNHSQFCEETLPRFFAHGNFASFLRQLNKYSFRKVKNVNVNAYGDHCWVYQHPHFRRNHRGDARHIVRKPVPKKETAAPPAESSREDDSVSIQDIQDQVKQLTHSQDDLRSRIMQLQHGQTEIKRSIDGIKDSLAIRTTAIQTLTQCIGAYLPPHVMPAETLRSPASQVGEVGWWHRGHESGATPQSRSLDHVVQEPSFPRLSSSPHFFEPPILTGSMGQRDGFHSRTHSHVNNQLTPQLVHEGSIGHDTPSEGLITPQAIHEWINSPQGWTHSPNVLLFGPHTSSGIVGPILESKGALVETVTDCRGLINKLSTSQYDLLVLESGLAPTIATFSIKEARRIGSKTPIVTLVEDTAQISAYRSAGLSDFLIPPFTGRRISEFLEKHLVFQYA